MSFVKGTKLQIKGGESMKNLVNLLIGLAAIVLVVGIISKLTVKPVLLGVGSKGLVGFAGALLLLAIALSVKK